MTPQGFPEPEAQNFADWIAVAGPLHPQVSFWIVAFLLEVSALHVFASSKPTNVPDDTRPRTHCGTVTRETCDEEARQVQHGSAHLLKSILGPARHATCVEATADWRLPPTHHTASLINYIPLNHCNQIRICLR